MKGKITPDAINQLSSSVNTQLQSGGKRYGSKKIPTADSSSTYAHSPSQPSQTALSQGFGSSEAREVIMHHEKLKWIQDPQPAFEEESWCDYVPLMRRPMIEQEKQDLSLVLTFFVQSIDARGRCAHTTSHHSVAHGLLGMSSVGCKSTGRANADSAVQLRKGQNCLNLQ